MKKSNGMLYWTGTGGDALLETDLSGNPTAEYVFFNGRRIARIDRPANTVEYYFSDHLGSADVITNASGTITKESDYYPYGGEIPVITGDSNRYKFSGKERDTESGLDNFGARYDSSSLGRFMTPDWAARPTAVPYAVFGDPQSLNLYGYVRNDPVSRADLDGHEGAEHDSFITGADMYSISSGFSMVGGVAPGDLLSQSNTQNKEIQAQQTALAAAKQAQNNSQPGSRPSQPKAVDACSVQMRYRDAAFGKTHAWWWVSIGETDYTISGTGKWAGVVMGGVINTYVAVGSTTSETNPKDNLSNGNIAFDRPASPENCAGARNMVDAALNFEHSWNDRFSYGDPLTSNSVARYVGNAGGFFPSPPPRSTGWSATFPGLE